MLDVVFNNEGQESCVLLGNREFLTAKRAPVTLNIAGKERIHIRIVERIDGLSEVD